MAKAHLEEALLTYTSLNVSVKVHQLQNLLQVTTLPVAAGISMPKPLLGLFSRFSNGLASYHNSIMALPNEKRDPQLKVFNGMHIPDPPSSSWLNPFALLKALSLLLPRGGLSLIFPFLPSTRASGCF
jgi:hypothetical protein